MIISYECICQKVNIRLSQNCDSRWRQPARHAAGWSLPTIPGDRRDHLTPRRFRGDGGRIIDVLGRYLVKLNDALTRPQVLRPSSFMTTMRAPGVSERYIAAMEGSRRGKVPEKPCRIGTTAGSPAPQSVATARSTAMAASSQVLRFSGALGVDTMVGIWLGLHSVDFLSGGHSPARMGWLRFWVADRLVSYQHAWAGHATSSDSPCSKAA
jgi:hypothetical protein